VPKIGVSDLDVTQRARRWGVGLLMLAIGAAIGYALPQSTASPRTSTGTVTSVSKATSGSEVQFMFRPKGASQTVPYTLEDPTPWRQQANSQWSTVGAPPCLKPGSSTPTPVTLGVVSISSVGSAPGGQMVVWVECYG
jgi:hypothetical protein